MPRYNIPPDVTVKVPIFDFSGGLNNTDEKHLIADNELTEAKNILIEGKAIEKRKGTVRWGNQIGTASKVLGLYNYRNSAGTNLLMCAYNTDCYKYVVGTWTALSRTLTTGQRMEFINAWNLVYMTNGEDIVAKYNGTAVTDLANFPVAAAGTSDRGYFWAFFKNRLVMAKTDNNPRRVYYSNLGADTIGTNNYFDVDDTVTGLCVFKDNLYIFTEYNVFRVDGFIFTDDVAEPGKVKKLNQDVGCVSHRSIKVCNGSMYWLGREDVYVSDGVNIYGIARRKIRGTLDSLYQTEFDETCAGVLKHRYYLGIRLYGSNKNDITLVYDTINKAWTYLTNFNPSCFAEVPNEANELELYFGSDNSSLGEVYQLGFGYSDAAENDLITNGSFETGLVGSVPTSWLEQYDAGVTGTVKKSALATAKGVYSCELIRSTGILWMNVHQDITVSASTTYQFSAWVKTAYQGTLSGDIYLHVIKSTSPYTVYCTLQCGNVDNSAGQYYYGTVNVPAGITGVSIGCVITQGIDTTPVYFDDIRLQEVGGSIPTDAQTKAFVFKSPYQNKKFKKTFISAKPSPEYNLLTTNYNLTLGHSASLKGAFTTASINLDESDKVEKYIRTSVKGKHMRYQFLQNGANQPFKVYGITCVFIPLKQLR